MTNKKCRSTKFDQFLSYYVYLLKIKIKIILNKIRVDYYLLATMDK